MTFFEQIKIWRETKAGYATFAAIELLAAAAFIIWALGPDGGWLDWLCAVILVSGATQNIFMLVQKVRRHDA